MSHAQRQAALALGLALAASACGQPASSCHVQQSDAQRLVSEEQTGSLRFVHGSDSQTLSFRAIMSGLRADDFRFEAGRLQLDLGLRYESEPFGGDGKTEMPRLSLAFDDFPPATAATTSNYPGNSSVFVSELFRDCPSHAAHCETVRSARITRMDGDPFPPVSVTWRATVEALLEVCTPNRDAVLALEVAEP